MLLLSLTVVFGAFLLFLVQPLTAAFILPWFGGAPAVWTTSMLFFQTVLLAGYAYAHGLARLPLRRQAIIHAVLVVAAVIALPIAPDASWRPETSAAPIMRILGLLGACVGLPYLVLSSTSTLMQAWAARLSSKSPYKLYAWSNAASLAALVVYPMVVEPSMGAQHQAGTWTWSFVGFAVFSLGCAGVAWRAGAGQSTASQARAAVPVDWKQIGAWIGLSAIPSALLLAVTESITTDVSVVPFFWVVPLALYLLTFIIVFAQDVVPAASRSAIAVGLGLVVFVPPAVLPGLHLATQVGLGCGGLFLICLGLHTELVRRRPAAESLTSFYLALSVGGALGGAAVAVVAPLLLSARIELPILMIASAVALLLSARRAWPVVAIAVCVVVVVRSQVTQGEVIERRRSFFGALRVEVFKRDGQSSIRHLVDGRVSHGMQVIDQPDRPQGYYGGRSGVRVAFAAVPSPRRVGLVGLGAGSLAALGQEVDVFRFYELNPDVIDVANTHFTYLKDSAADIEVIEGDARLSMAREPPQAYNLIILDAFTGDAVPSHLLTEEAMALWARHLTPDGLLVVHVSNHHLDLSLLVHGQVARLGWVSQLRVRTVSSPLGPFRSQWMIAGAPETMAALNLKANAPPSVDEGKVAPRWTDDHAPLWPILH